MTYERSYDYLQAQLLSHLDQDQIATVKRAYLIAEKAHAYQLRDEGTPYILHPLRVVPPDNKANEVSRTEYRSD